MHLKFLMCPAIMDIIKIRNLTFSAIFNLIFDYSIINISGVTLHTYNINNDKYNRQVGQLTHYPTLHPRMLALVVIKLV
jgi:hypothetical protein